MKRVPPAGATPREMSDAINRLMDGRSNAVIVATLTASATQTVISAAVAPNINEASYAFASPQTANAAAAMATTWAVVERVSGSLQLTIHHASAASTDRTFAFVLLGG